MTYRHPPRVATWLLSRFKSDDDPLVGDLVEEYQGGRSLAWYWNQVLIAVSRSTFGSIRLHWMLALRSTFFMWLYIDAYQRYVQRPAWVLYDSALRRFGLPPDNAEVWHHLYYLVPTIIVPFAAYAFISWVVAHQHRPHHAAFTVWNAGLIFLFGTTHLYRLVANSLESQRYRPYLYFYALSLAFTVTSILLGGLSRPPSRSGYTAR